MNEFLDHAITVRDLVNVAIYSISVLFVFLLTLAVLRLPERPIKRSGACRVPPLTEGYSVKGGHNGPSQITKRPPPPGAMRPPRAIPD